MIVRIGSYSFQIGIIRRNAFINHGLFFRSGNGNFLSDKRDPALNIFRSIQLVIFGRNNYAVDNILKFLNSSSYFNDGFFYISDSRKNFFNFFFTLFCLISCSFLILSFSRCSFITKSKTSPQIIYTMNPAKIISQN